IQAQSKTDWKEMYQVFNCGHRMEIYLPESLAQEIIDISKSFHVDAKIVGRVEKSAQNKLSIHSEFGTFEYF
ncbi:MAG: AIR synthase-related protein, partial [Lutimonas sp.]